MSLYTEAAAGILTRTALKSYLKHSGINEPSQERGKGTAGFTPLALAALHGHIEVVQLLLSHGAKADALSSNHRTPLWIVTAQGRGHSRARIVELLLKHKANARYSHPDLEMGLKPLENELLYLKDYEVIQLLVEENGTTAKAEKLAAQLASPEIEDAMKSTKERRKFRTATINLISTIIFFFLTVVNNAAITMMVQKIFANFLPEDNKNLVAYDDSTSSDVVWDLSIVGGRDDDDKDL